MKPSAILIFALGAVSLFGQRITDRRTAEIRGGGGDGKCTIEVYVDGAAEVEVIGRDAVIRTLNGAPSTIRRFQCNQEMPLNPYDFRFRGIDGRGRQDLVSAPDRGRRAVVRIEDPSGGSEGYTFDLMWRGGEGYGYGYGNDRGGYGGNRGDYGSNRGDYGNWNGWGNGSGWGQDRFDYRSRSGGGSYSDYRENRRLDGVNVNVHPNGRISVLFDSNRGGLAFNGVVERRDHRTIFARVNGRNGVNGLMEIEVGNRDQIRRIFLREAGRRRAELMWENR